MVSRFFLFVYLQLVSRFFYYQLVSSLPNMFSFWYKNVDWDLFSMPHLLSIGIPQNFCWFTYLFTYNWYHDSLHWYIFFNGIMFVLISPLEVFLFRTKRGRTCFLFPLTPLLMIDKKGEKYLILYACFYIGIKRVCFYVLLILVSRTWFDVLF